MMIIRIKRNRRDEFLSEVSMGIYRVRVTMSERYGMLLPIIDNVPGQRDVRIVPCGEKIEKIIAWRDKIIAAQRRREESWIIIAEPDPTAGGYDEATQK